MIVYHDIHIYVCMCISSTVQLTILIRNKTKVNAVFDY